MCFFRTVFLKQTSTFFVEVCMFYLYMGFVRFSNIFPQSKDVYVSLTGHSKWLSVLMLAQYETCLSSYQNCDRFHIRSQENGWMDKSSFQSFCPNPLQPWNISSYLKRANCVLTSSQQTIPMSVRSLQKSCSRLDKQFLILFSTVSNQLTETCKSKKGFVALLLKTIKVK